MKQMIGLAGPSGGIRRVFADVQFISALDPLGNAAVRTAQDSRIFGG
jgi:hypothetical protein